MGSRISFAPRYLPRDPSEPHHGTVLEERRGGEGSAGGVGLQSRARWRFIYYIKVVLSPQSLYKPTFAIHAEVWHGLKRWCQPEFLLYLPVKVEKEPVLPFPRMSVQ